jgi:hypothetical protein
MTSEKNGRNYPEMRLMDLVQHTMAGLLIVAKLDAILKVLANFQLNLTGRLASSEIT